MGIMPVAGIPLPFMSYGGSAVIATFAGIGLVLNVRMRRFSDVRAGPRPPRPSGGTPLHWSRDMTSLWPQIEPILAHVQKPARYIGCEDGAVAAGSLAGRVGWLLIYPDAYEIGLPNQGLQILYELLNERPRRPGRALLRPLGRHGGPDAPAGPAPVLGRQPPARRPTSTCWPSTSRPSWCTPTCSTAWTWPACRSGPPTAVRSTRWSSPAATAPSTPSRWPTSWTSSSSATARRWSAKSPSAVRGLEGGRAYAPGRGNGCCATWRAVPGVYVPVLLRRGLRRAAAGRGHAPVSRRARAGREADHRRSGRLALPQAAAGAA